MLRRTASEDARYENLRVLYDSGMYLLLSSRYSTRIPTRIIYQWYRVLDSLCWYIGTVLVGVYYNPA